MSKRKYSSVWFHFEDKGHKAKCKYCQTVLSSSGGSHGNLKRHLKAKHPAKAFNLESEVVSSAEIMKFEEPIDGESCKQIRTITQDYELSEFIKIPTTIHKVEKNNVGCKNLNSTQKKRHSTIWLHFEDEDDKRATCKYCKATLCYSGGSHGNLNRHLKSKHPSIILDAEFKELNIEEVQNYCPKTVEQLRLTTHAGTVNQQQKQIIWNRNKIKQKYFKSLSKRKHSISWLHFDDIGSKRAMCKHCKKTINFTGGCHGNLGRHMKLKHPLILLNMKRKNTHKNDLLDLEEGIVEQSIINTHIKPISQKLNVESQIFKEQIDHQVLKMIAKGNHSLSILDEPEFKKLIDDVANCPGYTLPSKDVVSVSLLPNIYIKLLEDIKSKIPFATAVCLTTDGWKCKTDTNCFTITAHYINSETVLTSHLLAYAEFENTHTPVDLCNFINNTICKFEIKKVSAIVSTNEKNIGAAISQGGWRSITCFAHSLHLLLNSAITEIDDTIQKVKIIAECFNKSNNALKELQPSKNHNAFVWTSIFEMLQGIVKIKDKLIANFSLDRPDVMLALEDWEIIAEVLKILKPFHEVAVEISVEKYIPLSKVTILSNLLEKHIAKCLPSSDEVTAMVINLQIGLASQFGNLENVDLYAESTLLDPRFKRIGFKTDNSYQQALQSLKNKICAIKLPTAEKDNYDPMNTVTQESLWETYDTEFNKVLKKDDSTVAGARELDNYMNEEYLDRRKNPLVWWNERKHLYPRLYTNVLKRICIVANSLECDLIFTSMGQNICERRCILPSNEIDRLIFLHNNM